MRYLKLFVFMLMISLGVKAQQEVRIAVLTDERGQVENFEVLKKEISSVLGSNYIVEFQQPLFNNYNLDSARENYKSLDASSTELIIATGTANAILFFQEKDVKIPTIVVSGVNKDLIRIPPGQKTSQKNNVNYIVLPNSYTDDLDDFVSVFDYKRIGIIIQQKKLDALPIKPVFDDYFEDKQAEYEFIPLINNEIDTALLNTVDAVYLADRLREDEASRQIIIKEINKRKLPSFSANGIKDIENGLLATNKPESTIDQLIRKIALHSESIITGTNPSELPLILEYRTQLTINHTTAREIGLRLKYSLLGIANITGSEKSEEQIQNEISLKTLMQQVLDNNLSLSVDEKSVTLAEQDVKASKNNYLPDLGANVQGIYIDPEVSQYSTGQNPEFETKGNVELKQLIYSPDVSAGVKINEKISEAQQANYDAAQLDAMYNIAAAYFNALVLRANVNIQNQNLQVTKQNLEIANQNFDAGSSGKTDVLRFRSQLAQNIQNVIDAGNQLQQVKLTINQLRNASLKTDFQLEDVQLSSGLFKDYNYQTLMNLLDSPDLIDKLVEFFVHESLRNSPELKGLDLNMQANDLNYKLNKNGRFIPTVALQGQYNLSLLKEGKGSSIPPGYPVLPDNTYNAAISVSLPVFNQNTRNTNKQTAMIQGEQLALQKQNLEFNLEKQIRETVLDLMSDIANIELSKLSEKTAKESLDLAQTAYQTGSIPVIQLIDAQVNYMQAQLGNTTAKYQFLLTSLQLERYLGLFFIMQTPEENKAFYERAKQFISNK